MTEHDLKRALAAIHPPSPSPEAEGRALHRASLALSQPAPQPGSACPARHPRSRFTLMLSGFVAACVITLCGWLALHIGTTPTASIVSIPPSRELLTRTEELFPGRLNAIVIRDGFPQLDLSAETGTPAHADQAVLIELTRNGHHLRILSYSGRSVSVRLDGAVLSFVPLLTTTDDILLSGHNFIWTKTAPNRLAGWNVTTRPLVAL